MRSRVRRAALMFGLMLMPLLARGGDDASADAKLIAHSVWRGTWATDSRLANGHSERAVLRVKSRKEDHVVAVFKIGDGKNPRSIRIEGVVDSNGSLKLKPVEVESGDWGNHALRKIYVGQVRGDELAFRMLDAANGDPDPNAQAAKVELKLSNAKE